MEKTQRGDKTVTIVRGTDDDLKGLAKFLKTRCGVGGGIKRAKSSSKAACLGVIMLMPVLFYCSTFF